MSAFEASAWNWYWRNASGWAARMGITALEFQGLRLRGEARSLWLEAMSMIEGMVDEIKSRQAGRE